MPGELELIGPDDLRIALLLFVLAVGAIDLAVAFIVRTTTEAGREHAGDRD